MLSVILFLFSVLVSGLCSSIETAIISLNPLNTLHGNQKRLTYLYQLKERIIASCLVGNNFSIVTGTIIMANFIYSVDSIFLQILLFISEILIFFIMAEMIPKLISQKLYLPILQYGHYPILIFYYMSLPISFIFLYLSQIIIKIAGIHPKMHREDIFYFLGLHTAENKKVRGLMNFNVTTSKEVMTPLGQIISLSEEQTLQDLLPLMEQYQYVRYPIYKDRTDNITGYVHVCDLVKMTPHGKLIKKIHEAHFISEFISCEAILAFMGKMKTPIVFVINEFSSIIGLVTLDNLAEELVGTIPKDIISTETKIIPHKKDSHTYILSGTLGIDEFNLYCNLSIKKEGFETIAGFLIKHTVHIPHTGQTILTSFGLFIIQKASKTTIHKIKFIKITESSYSPNTKKHK